MCPQRKFAMHLKSSQATLRLKFLLPAGIAAILTAAAFVLIIRPGPPPRPNIILISFDTLRADRLGCYGCPVGTSPNIDAFSRESVQFMRAISQAPSTATSHMSLFTGLLPPVHRVSSWLRLPERARQLHLSSLGAEIPTMAQYLKENGYRTVGLHSGGLVSPFFGFDRGFDLYTDKKISWRNLFKTPAPLRIIKNFLRPAHDAKDPLFLFLHTYICHGPYIKAPQKIRERFLPDPVPGLPVDWDTPKKSFWDMSTSFWKTIDGNNPAHRRHVRALYDAQVNYADWIFGEIVALLKRNDLYDKTLIALVSDHGEEFWEHGGTTHKHLFIETLHVPLLIKFPDGEYGGKKIKIPVAQFDLMPTLLGYLRIKPRLKPQAESLLPQIRGEKTTHGPVLSFDDGLQFLRIRQGKFVYSNGIRGTPGNWIYSSISDPHEQYNLATTSTQTLLQMKALAAKIMNEQQMLRARIGGRSSVSGKLPKDVKKQLETLGYL
jgi:arylsulfatase A-like enzyme